MTQKQITAWSFSRYSDYAQCPLKAKLKHLDKIKEPPAPPLERGAAIHDKIAEYLVKPGRAVVPKELGMFRDLARYIRKMYKKKSSRVVVEDMWAFTSDWTETHWKDWAGCRVRIKLDAAYLEEMPSDMLILHVVDWKTGKYRREMNEAYVEQLELYALAALLKFPDVDEVRPRLAYVDQGLEYPSEGEPMVYTHKDMPKLKKAWEKRTRAMLRDKKFAPRPNDKCKWCHYRKANKASGGGQCKF